MTSEDLKKMLASLGVNVEELKDAALEKAEAWLDAQKSLMDTQTRRKMRVFWGSAAAVMTVVGFAAGFYVAQLMG